MQYQGGSTPGASRLITPLAIVMQEGIPYLSAYCHRSRCTKTFRIDRIKSLSEP